MKKLLYIFLSFTVFAVACDPNEEIYEELDKQLDVAPSADVELTLTDADYALAIPEKGDNIEKFKNFSSEEEAKQYVPNILTGLYPQLGGSSLALVTYKVYRPYSYRNAEAYTATDEDYEFIGGNTAKYKNFSYDSDIVKILTNKFTGVEHGKTIAFTSQFREDGTTYTRTKNFIYLDDAWRAPYELTKSDYYDVLQNQYTNFDNADQVNEKLPIFMGLRFPYAKAGEKMAVEYTWTYKDDAGDRQYEDRVIFLGYDGSIWSIIGNTVNRTLQFGYEKTTWVADNTIKYTLLADDFALIGANFENAKGDVDKYNNINMGTYSEDQIVAFLNVVLKNKFPNAEVGQKYLVSFATYNPRGTAERHLILNEEGNYVIKE